MKGNLACLVLTYYVASYHSVSAQYVEPTWWPIIQSTFDGVNLKRCYKRDGTIKPLGPPPNGDPCAQNPKTCFFGEQNCDGVAYPATKCLCNDQIWQCEEELCPDPMNSNVPSTAPSSTDSCQKPSALAELDSFAVSCIPTTGSCIASDAGLQDAASSAGDGDVLSICSGTTISATSTITLTARDLTLCCEDTTKESCVVEGSGSVRILEATGDNFVFSGITFRGGGLPVVDALSSIIIVDCQFEEGDAGDRERQFFFGGTEVTMLRSRFSNAFGTTSFKTWALSAKTLVQECEFEENAIAISADVIEIYASKFIGNKRTPLFVSAFGEIPKLDVVLSVFEDNTGGAGFLNRRGGTNLNLRLCGNQGSGNTATPTQNFDCDGFYGVYDQGTEICVAVNEDI